MRQSLFILSAFIVIGLPAISAAEEPAASDELTCTYPVKSGDTSETLLTRFGSEAVATELPGAEGEIVKGVVLFPNDENRRLHVYFFDDEMLELASVQPDYGVTGWKAAGLAIGDTLETLLDANGGPFEMTGFGWDYGGYITSFQGGALDNIGGDCSLSIRLYHDSEMQEPEELIGDRIFSSSTESLKALNPSVASLALTWAAP